MRNANTIAEHIDHQRGKRAGATPVQPKGKTGFCNPRAQILSLSILSYLVATATAMLYNIYVHNLPLSCAASLTAFHPAPFMLSRLFYLCKSKIALRNFSIYLYLMCTHVYE